MMTFDEKDRNRRCDDAAGGNWYSVERAHPATSAGRATLANHIGERLRMIYRVSLAADEPPALRLLLAELEAKGI